ncbi:magnesium transporter [Mycobacterium sp. NPDC050551]|uniref:magnesium transporter n=1 Tax=Mycobacterium sp. NPDC050551 TaxID=3155407 RepID=UPI00342CFC93
MTAPAESAPVTREILGPSDRALSHASSRVPIAPRDAPVSDVLDAMRGRQFDSAAAVAVVDGERLAGVVTIERMFGAAEGARVCDVMDPTTPVVAPDTDQEHAAWRALQRAEPGLAVVDADGRFRGLVSPQELLRVLLQEHDEDLARLGGFVAGVESARSTSVESVRRRLWHRLPWLLLGLLGAMASAVLMTAFEDQLTANLAVAYFLPGIVYLADAVGTQTETLAIRGLSVDIGIRRIAGREALTGLLMGVVLGGLIMPVATLMTGDAALALAVSIAVVGASTVATVVALVLPWVLNRLGKDPAFGSGPLATVVQDLLSIVLYFGAVALLLG